MSTQKREITRNYIGIVSDEADQHVHTRAQPRSSQPMKDYIRGLLAGLKPRGETH